MIRSAVDGRLAMVTPIRARMPAWWAGTGVRRSGSESTTWTSQPRLTRWRAATRPPPPLPPGPARTVTEPGEKRVIASSARLRPAFSIIWTSSMCRSSTMARSTARICSVVSAGTALRLTVRIGLSFPVLPTTAGFALSLRSLGTAGQVRPEQGLIVVNSPHHGFRGREGRKSNNHLTSSEDEPRVQRGFLVVKAGLPLHALPAVERHSREVHPPWLRPVGEGSLQGTGVGLAVLRRGVDLLRPFQIRDGRVERGWICRSVVADDDGVITRHFFQGLENGDPVVEVDRKSVV